MGDCVSNPKQKVPVNKILNRLPQNRAQIRNIGLLKKSIPQKNQQKKPMIIEYEKWIQENKKIQDYKILVRKPTNEQKIFFQEIYEPKYQLPKQISQASQNLIRKAPFQAKLEWLRHNLDKHRIPWTETHERIVIDRQNILFSGIQALKTADLRKELKIIFKDEKVDDAGGLLREWMHMSIQEIFSQELKIFQLCKTDELSYNFIKEQTVEEIASVACQILGYLIGKAILQRIPLGCFLNRALIRTICGQPIQFEDIYSVDKDLYNSWKYILDETNIEGFETDSLNGLKEIELIPGGKSIRVTNKNKNMFIMDTIQYHCYIRHQRYIEILRNALYQVVPKNYLSVLEPYEFDLIVNGPQTIDVKEWRKYSKYVGYQPLNPIVQQFWLVLSQLKEEELRNFLHFCTGVTRVPVNGFGYLEGNRQVINLFTIKKIKYEGSYMYPRAYTCFNRLELPDYPTSEELKQKIVQISQNQFYHFGLS